MKIRVYKKRWLWVLVIAVIVLAGTVIGMLVTQTGLATFTSNAYGVSLKYPTEWVLDSADDEKGQGKDGFFNYQLCLERDNQ